MSTTDTACAIGSSASSVQTIICTKATLKRKKKPKLNFYRSVPSSSRQHTQYQVHQDGSISYTLQRLKPPKNAKPTINNQSRPALTLHDAPFSIPEPFDDLPLDVSLDFLGQQRRKRTAGVCTLWFSESFHTSLTVIIQDHPLLMWLKYRGLFLREIIRLEGRCNKAGAQCCSECDCPTPEYRCRDCLGSELYCSACILSAHVRHPLHRLEVHFHVWAGD